MSDERESPQESDEQQADSRSAVQDADTLKAISELVDHTAAWLRQLSAAGGELATLLRLEWQLTLGERKRSGSDLAQEKAATCIQRAWSQRQHQQVAAVGQRDARAVSHEGTDMATKPGVLNNSMCSTAGTDVAHTSLFFEFWEGRV